MIVEGAEGLGEEPAAAALLRLRLSDRACGRMVDARRSGKRIGERIVQAGRIRTSAKPDRGNADQGQSSRLARIPQRLVHKTHPTHAITNVTI